MSKISYSYFALRRLSDVPKKSDSVLSKQLSKKLQEKESRLSGGPPTVSGGFNVYAPGHIVLENSIDVPKKSDCALTKELSKKLQEKEITNLTNFVDLSRIPDTKYKRDYDLYPPIRSMEKSEKSDKLVGIGGIIIDTSIRYQPKQETEDHISFKPDTHLRNDLYPPTRSPITWEPKSKVLKPKESESISNQCQSLGSITGSESPKNSSNKTIETIEFPKKTVEKDITDESYPEGNISQNNSKFEAWIEKINPDKPSLPSNFEFPKSEDSFGTNI